MLNSIKIKFKKIHVILKDVKRAYITMVGLTRKVIPIDIMVRLNHIESSIHRQFTHEEIKSHLTRASFLMIPGSLDLLTEYLTGGSLNANETAHARLTLLETFSKYPNTFDITDVTVYNAFAGNTFNTLESVGRSGGMIANS